MKKYSLIALLVSSLTSLISCASFSQNQTDQGTGIHPGPATVASSNISLQNSRYNALTVNGDLNANNLSIMNSLSVESSLLISNSLIKDDTLIAKDLNATNSKFADETSVNGNIHSDGSYFGNDVKFAGNLFELINRSKVAGNIYASNESQVVIKIEHSVVTGNIYFKKAPGVVILGQRGVVKGKIINGSLQK